MSTEKLIANNIKDLIKQSGKTVLTLSQELKVPNSQIYAYIKGDYLPGALMIIKLCESLGCEYEDILGRLNS